jgi:multiple sugar transport system substrate-binding protein
VDINSAPRSSRPWATRRRLAALPVAAIVLGAGVAACSSSSPSSAGSTAAGSTQGAAGGTYTIWDPYPQFTQGSAWTSLLARCGSAATVRIKRIAFDTTALTSKVLLAAQQGVAPDVLIVDNPVVSTLAEAGVLTDTSQNHIDTSAIQPNLMGAGEYHGKTYGIPIGANTLALYYNKNILKAAGVNPASVKDWGSLTAALAKVKATGKKGITFSAIGTEEGTFQFEPWFWGAGANLTKLDSSGAAAALALWTGWLKAGYAPNSVINDTQTTSWQEFAAGNTAFSENGTWQLSNAQKAGFPFGIIPIPAEHGGAAPVPTGGEFVTVPVQHDTARYATSEKIVSCLSTAGNAYTTDNTLSYVAPTTAVQAKQVVAEPALGVWVQAVHAGKARTGDNLGTNYPKISQQLWTAVQSALSGSASPQAALATAQTAAASATNGQ